MASVFFDLQKEKRGFNRRALHRSSWPRSVTLCRMGSEAGEVHHERGLIQSDIRWAGAHPSDTEQRSEKRALSLF